jgi:hypothetical protein
MTVLYIQYDSALSINIYILQACLAGSHHSAAVAVRCSQTCSMSNSADSTKPSQSSWSKCTQCCMVVATKQTPRAHDRSKAPNLQEAGFHAQNTTLYQIKHVAAYLQHAPSSISLAGWGPCARLLAAVLLYEQTAHHCRPLVNSYHPIAVICHTAPLGRYAAQPPVS